ADPSGIVVMDLDANDLPDIAAPGKGSNNVVVMRQHPDRDFFTDRSYLNVPAPEDLIAADLDGDGAPDLATVGGGTGEPSLVAFFTRLADCGAPEDGYTSCVFAAPGGVSPLVALDSADLDGDGDFDVVCAGGSYAVTFSNHGAGFDPPVAILVAGADLTDVTASDVNGDGTVDIVATDAGGGALIALLGAGDGTFSGTATVLVGGLEGPVEIAPASLDANAVSDFVVAEAGGQVAAGGIRVALGSGSGAYSAARLARQGLEGALPPAPRAIALADLDADGLEDIISVEVIDTGTSGSELAVYEQAPSGSFRSPALTLALDSAGGEPSQPSFAAADYSGDAYTDLITVLRASSEIVVYDQVGPGSFDTLRMPIPSSVPAVAPMAIAAGDIDGDDRVDVVTANFDSGNLTALLQGESGGLESATAISSDALSGPQSVALGDIDGDGRLDVVTAGRLSNTVLVFGQRQDGTFDGGTDLSASLEPGTDFESPIALALGDLDGDGRLEIISANHRSENLTVFFAGEKRPIVIPLGETDRPVAIALGDLDGDGRIDILTANTTGAAASLARQTDAGSF
ncbi:MAG: VCBS repeat-containing protein, partial [Actinobacteria bacterium]|nr:VCBS repeat-containing protein [Actinomycetota bacterium]